MRYLGGHLGTTVSALVDGQLDPSSAERAWSHVQGCQACRSRVEREGWVKTRLATIPGDQGPPEQLLGSLYGLSAGQRAHDASLHGAAAWAAVEQIERSGRGRRRAGLALAGVGSVSAAVFGLASLTGSTLGIGASGGTPTSSPSSVATTVIAPLARVHGRLPVESLRREGPGAAAPSPSEGRRHTDLRP